MNTAQFPKSDRDPQRICLQADQPGQKLEVFRVGRHRARPQALKTLRGSLPGLDTTLNGKITV